MYISTFMGPSAATATQDGPLIRQCLDVAERCAAAGFAMVTFGEQHSNNYEPYCNPLLMAARLSPVLGDTWFGTTVMPLPFHSVLRLAEDTSVVDNLLEGRFVVGMSAGLAPMAHVFKNFGIDVADRNAVFTAKLDALQRAYRHTGPGPLPLDTPWDSETMGGRLMPTPFRNGGPQIAVGTNTVATIDDVARRQLALFLGPCSTEDAAALLARHRDGLVAGGAGDELVDHLTALSMVTRQVITGSTDEEAWETAELMAGTSPLLDRTNDTRSMREIASVPIEDADNDPFPRNVRHVNTWFLAGSVDSVTEQLLAYDKLGVRHVNTRFTLGTYRPEVVERQFELFTAQVLPALSPQKFTAPTGSAISAPHRPDADVFAPPMAMARPNIPAMSGSRTA